MNQNTTDKVNNILTNLYTPSPTSKILEPAKTHTNTPFNVARTINKLGLHQSKVPLKLKELIDANPTIEYFRNIKSKRIKAPSASSPHTSSRKQKSFNPFDKEKLLERLSSFSVLNWGIQSTTLTELKCARNGWTAENSGVKNTLKCVSCHHHLTLKMPVQNSSDTLEDEMDNQAICDKLIANYLVQLKEAHHVSCSWRAYESPIESYLINFNDLNVLLGAYIDRLNTLIENRSVLSSICNLRFQSKINENDLKILDIYSNKALTNLRSYSVSHSATTPISSASSISSDSNQSGIPNSKVHPISNYFLEMSVLGWELTFQEFNYQKVLLLICKKCNRRILMGEITSIGESVKLSPSRILSPCKYPSTKVDSSFIFVDEEEENNSIDLISEHKSWCCYVSSPQVTNNERFSFNSIINKSVGYELILLMIKSLVYDKNLNEDTLLNANLIETPNRGPRLISSKALPAVSLENPASDIGDSLSTNSISGDELKSRKAQKIINTNGNKSNFCEDVDMMDTDSTICDVSINRQKRTIDQSLDRLSKLRKLYMNNNR